VYRKFHPRNRFFDRPRIRRWLVRLGFTSRRQINLSNSINDVLYQRGTHLARAHLPWPKSQPLIGDSPAHRCFRHPYISIWLASRPVRLCRTSFHNAFAQHPRNNCVSFRSLADFGLGRKPIGRFSERHFDLGRCPIGLHFGPTRAEYRHGPAFPISYHQRG
jgi:hypothetical protein